MICPLYQLHKEYVGHSPTGISLKKLDPLIVAQEVIRAIGAKLGIPNAAKLKAGYTQWSKNSHLFLNAATKGSTRRIELCRLFFIDLKKFAQSGQVEGRTNKLFQRFSDWVHETFKLKPHPITGTESAAISCYIRFIKDPRKAKEMLRFLIGHELGHVKAREEKITFTISRLTDLQTGLVVVAALVASAVLAIFLHPYPPLLCGAIGIIFATIAMMTSRSWDHHAEEYYCDQIGASDRAAAKAGIQFFKIFKKIDGDDGGSKHPNQSDRIVRLEERLKSFKNTSRAPLQSAT